MYHRNQKGVIHLFVTLIFALTVFSGIVYWAYNNGRVRLRQDSSGETKITPFIQTVNQTSKLTGPQENDFEITDSTTPGWKSYMNREYGFSIDIPAPWFLKVRNEYPDYPKFYISKTIISQYNECHSQTSCLVIIPSVGGRGGLPFEVKSIETEYNGINFTGSRMDFYDMHDNLYGSYVLFNLDPKRPKWSDGLIDLYPLIHNIQLEETGLPDIPENQFRLERLEEVNTDKEDTKILNQILSTFKFVE